MKAHIVSAVAALGIASLASGQSARAATATTTFPVTATVLTACAVTADPLAFGNYDPTSATPLEQSATLSVLCTVGTSFTVGLNAGATSGATVSTRQMSDGSNVLDYSLYSDSGHTTNWGNTPGSDTPAATVAPVLPTELTVYGRVPAEQNVPPGPYADTITVTVNY